MSQVPDNDSSTAQSQRFAAAETLQQLPHAGSLNARAAFVPRAETSPSYPLATLNTSQYPQLPPLYQHSSHDASRNPASHQRLPELNSTTLTPNLPNPIPHINNQQQSYGHNPAAQLYQSVPPIPPDQFDTTNTPGTSRSHDPHLLTPLGGRGYNDAAAKKEESPEPQPSWADLKTKAGKDRKRLPLACIACRRKKIRCSGEKPSCKHCLRSRNPCTYKASARKAVPRTDYFAMLDKRLKRMEERVIKAIPNEDTKPLPRATVRPGDHGAEGKTSHGKKRTAKEAFEPDWSGWANRPSMPAQLSRGSENDGSIDVTEGLDKLPSAEIQEHLAEVFFDCVYGQSYHLLHKPSFMQRLKKRTVPPVLILAVCAISARFSTHPQLDSEPRFLRGEEWAQPARDIALKYYDEPNITILTVYLLLGLHAFGTCQGGRSWMLGGMAVRMAFALQLNRDLDQEKTPEKAVEASPGKSQKLSFVDEEIRRRTMFACFLMDRYTSSGSDRATFISEKKIDIQLPIRERNFQRGIPGKTECLEQYLSRSKDPKREVDETSFDKKNERAEGRSELRHELLAHSNSISRDNRIPTQKTGPPDQDEDLEPEAADQPKANMGVAAYIVRAVALWHMILHYMNLGGRQRDQCHIWDPQSHFFELKRQAHDLITSLPERLRNTEENLHTHAAEKLGNQFLFLHIICNQVSMCLYRFAIPSSPTAKVPEDIPEQFVKEAIPIALEAASNVSRLLEKAQEHNVTAPFAGYCAFMSSTVHIWGVFSEDSAFKRSSRKHLETNVQFLNKMKKYWGMFHFLGENLKGIYRHYEDAAKEGAQVNESGQFADYGMVQYSDWFSKYPHGFSKRDFIDPIREAEKENKAADNKSQKSDGQQVKGFFQPEPAPEEFQRQRKATRVRRNTVRKEEKANATARRQSATEQEEARTQFSVEEPQTVFHPPMMAPQIQAEMPQIAVISPTSMPSHTLYTPSHPNFPPTYPLIPDTPNIDNAFLNQQLDRQLIYGAYSNLDPNGPGLDTIPYTSLPSSEVNTLGPPEQMHSGHGMGWNNADLMAFSQPMLHNASLYGTLPNNAWSAPFNLNPPAMVDESLVGSFMGRGNPEDFEGREPIGGM